MAPRKRVHRNATRTVAAHATPPALGTAPPTRDPAATWRSLVAQGADAMPDVEALAREIVNHVAPARTALDAELAVCEWLGLARRHLAVEGSSPVDGSWSEGTDTIDGLFNQVARAAERQASPAALATLRVLVTLAPPRTGQVAADAAQQLTDAGVEDRPWVARLGMVDVLGAWTTYDVNGFQRSVGLLLAEGRRHHSVNALIDYPLGGGVKDLSVDVGARAERWRGELLASSLASGTIFEDLDVDAALQLLAPAVAAPPCPWSASQVLDVTRYLPLLAARVRTVAGAASATPR